MAVKLQALDQIYDGANSKWVQSGVVSTSFADSAAAATQTTGALGILGHKYVSMAVTLADIKGSPAANTLDAKLQYTIDGTNWTDLGSGAISQLTAAGTNTVTQKAIQAFKALRIYWTLAFTGGTSPTADVTFRVITTQ